MPTNTTDNSQLTSQNIEEANAFLQELKDRTRRAYDTGNQSMMFLYTELLTVNTPIIAKAIVYLESGEQAAISKEPYDQRRRHFIILPTNHEDVLHLNNKLLNFHDCGWKVRDFGAFGAFDCGFLVIEIDDLQGYYNFKRDMCNLLEQGIKYVYPEHIVCWL